MTAAVDDELRAHLLRPDGQEDVCLALYRPSTGRDRTTGVLTRIVPPRDGERFVHGNASITGDYVLRAAAEAARDGAGVAMLHSHPCGSGWQGLSTLDAAAERSSARLVHGITGHPLLGLTLAGFDRAWSARSWSPDGAHTWAENVRVVGDRLRVTWNDAIRPAPPVQPTQVRTVSAWGERTQADLARLRILLVGAGSVGLDLALRLAATGIRDVAVMDFDIVEDINLDRLIGATPTDARLRRGKAEVAVRLMRAAATAGDARPMGLPLSVCDPAGFATALDYDLIFSCVDRPWPRAVLNGLAYTDLIPVIDGGIAVDAFDDGNGMRNATWRSHVVRPGRPCLACNGQLDLAEVQLDRQGLLGDRRYIAGAGLDRRPARQNVAALSASVSASQLAQFVSYTVAPGGQGDPGPLRYSLSTHWLEHVPVTSREHCPVEHSLAAADDRIHLTGAHPLTGRTGRVGHERRLGRIRAELRRRLLAATAALLGC